MKDKFCKDWETYRPKPGQVWQDISPLSDFYNQECVVERIFLGHFMGGDEICVEISYEPDIILSVRRHTFVRSFQPME